MEAVREREDARVVVKPESVASWVDIVALCVGECGRRARSSSRSSIDRVVDVAPWAAVEGLVS